MCTMCPSKNINIQEIIYIITNAKTNIVHRTIGHFFRHAMRILCRRAFQNAL